MQVALDRFGRMVLPKALRDDLGLQPGDKLEVEEKGQTVLLRAVRDQDAVHSKQGVLVFLPTTSEGLADAVKSHREAQLDRAAAWRQRVS